MLAIALLASLVVWNLPFGGVLLYPFKLLGTWMHELSHGITMLATGAGFDQMRIYRDTSGLAYAGSTIGPFGSAIIAAAGYMGTPVWGAVLLVSAATPRGARNAVFALAALLGISALFIIANDFGQWAIGGCAVGFAVAAVALPLRWRVAVVQFVAAQACINAVLDVRVLFRPAQVVDGVMVRASDAHNMASLTFGTTDDWAVRTWVVAWLVWSLAVLFVALRISGSRSRAYGSRIERAAIRPA